LPLCGIFLSCLFQRKRLIPFVVELTILIWILRMHVMLVFGAWEGPMQVKI
jgi:hypothetical protein